MGDVKRSGKTYEERKAAAIARQKAEAERRRAIVVKAKAEKTPEQKLEQKLKEDRGMMVLAAILGMAGPRSYFPLKHK